MVDYPMAGYGRASGRGTPPHPPFFNRGWATPLSLLYAHAHEAKEKNLPLLPTNDDDDDDIRVCVRCREKIKRGQSVIKLPSVPSSDEWPICFTDIEVYGERHPLSGVYG